MKVLYQQGNRILEATVTVRRAYDLLGPAFPGRMALRQAMVELTAAAEAFDALPVGWNPRTAPIAHGAIVRVKDRHREKWGKLLPTCEGLTVADVTGAVVKVSQENPDGSVSYYFVAKGILEVEVPASSVSSRAIPLPGDETPPSVRDRDAADLEYEQDSPMREVRPTQTERTCDRCGERTPNGTDDTGRRLCSECVFEEP